MKVQLISKTIGVNKYEKLNSEEIIAAIARHGVIKEDNGKLVKYLMDNAHWSPLDMINFTFEIETSRDIGRQILRHQSIKFQEHSTRYSDRVLFEPIELRREDKINRQSSTEVFNPPLATFTNIFDEEETSVMDAQTIIKDYLEDTTMTANGTLRSWLAFLNVRCDHHAEKEIQIIANIIGETLQVELPNIFKEINWKNGMFM